MKEWRELMKKSAYVRKTPARTRRCRRAIKMERLEDRRLLTAASLIGLGDLGGGDYDSIALGISDDGQTVVGRSNGADGRNEPFRWTLSDGMTSLGSLPGSTTGDSARAASADGSVVVGQSDLKSFRWTNGQLTEIAGGGLSQGYIGAYDVSDDGQIVVGVENGEAYRWEAGTVVGLGDIEGGSVQSVAIADR